MRFFPALAAGGIRSLSLRGFLPGLLLYAVILVAALVGACAADTGDHSLGVVFDPCQPVSLVPADANADELASLDGAIEMWSRMGIGALARAPEGAALDPAAGGLEVRFEEAAPIFYGVYDDESGVVFINRRLGGHARAVTIAHEVGHALGLPHISGRDSVMNPENLVHEPNSDDAGDLESLWGDCAILRASD